MQKLVLILLFIPWNTLAQSTSSVFSDGYQQQNFSHLKIVDCEFFPMADRNPKNICNTVVTIHPSKVEAFIDDIYLPEGITTLDGQKTPFQDDPLSSVFSRVVYENTQGERQEGLVPAGYKKKFSSKLESVIDPKLKKNNEAQLAVYNGQVIDLIYSPEGSGKSLIRINKVKGNKTIKTYRWVQESDLKPYQQTPPPPCEDESNIEELTEKIEEEADRLNKYGKCINKPRSLKEVSAYEATVGNYWNQNGGSSSDEQIDALARSLFGEMRETRCKNVRKEAMAQIASVYINRAEVIQSNSKYRSRYSHDKLKKPALIQAVSKPYQVYVWNRNDPNLDVALCPLKDPNPESRKAWYTALEIAKVAVENPKGLEKYIQKVNQRKAYNYSSDDSVISGYKADPIYRSPSQYRCLNVLVPSGSNSQEVAIINEFKKIKIGP